MVEVFKVSFIWKYEKGDFHFSEVSLFVSILWEVTCCFLHSISTRCEPYVIKISPEDSHQENHKLLIIKEIRWTKHLEWCMIINIIFIKITGFIQKFCEYLLSHPARGVWIKAKCEDLSGNCWRCHIPQGVCELKRACLPGHSGCYPSHPARGVWIKAL